MKNLLNSEEYLTLQAFPLRSWPWYLIQEWYFLEELDTCHFKELKSPSKEKKVPQNCMLIIGWMMVNC